MDGDTAQDWGRGVFDRHCDLECIVQPQLPPVPQEHTDNLWMGENRLRQIILPRFAAAVRYPPATIIHTTPVAVVMLCY